jgi:uncharacterized protein (DUF1800 family)
MARDPKFEAALALHRFGCGPRTGSIDAIASDPRGALIAELDRPGAGQINNPELLTSAQAGRAVFEFNSERTAKDRLEKKRKDAERERMAAEGMEPPPEPKPEMTDGAASAEPKELPLPQRIFRQEVKARIDAALAAEIGFAERLTWFWSNHFCISASKVPARPGGYEREAIRPYVLGRFVDMLLAVEGHPAMLMYLDNAQSIGPMSVAGINRDRGLNENLAREILELHTLGVRSVYTQDDVTGFAKILTGWTVIPIASDPERGGEFIFNKRMHEPGSLTVVGKTYEDTGVEQGRAVLRDLARHPATAKHVAGKLARHFVADEPPPALVDRLAKTFLDSDGDLKQVATALVSAPEAWAAEPGKLKRPGEWIVALLRATGVPPNIQRILGAHNLLGEPLWRPSAPKGFPDDDAAWIDGLSQRLEMANQVAQRIVEQVVMDHIVDIALGPLASAETRSTIARAETRQQALALLLMAPEFQRR